MQGRSAESGLDCVGLVAAAYAAAGRKLSTPVGYPLRGWGHQKIAEILRQTGFLAAAGPPRCGDVGVAVFAAGQFHLGLRGRDRVVHAHAGLRRVVEAPLDEVWRAAAYWRLEI